MDAEVLVRQRCRSTKKLALGSSGNSRAEAEGNHTEEEPYFTAASAGLDFLAPRTTPRAGKSPSAASPQALLALRCQEGRHSGQAQIREPGMRLAAIVRQPVASGRSGAPEKGSEGLARRGGCGGGTFAGGSRDGSPPHRDDRTRSVSATGQWARMSLASCVTCRACWRRVHLDKGRCSALKRRCTKHRQPRILVLSSSSSWSTPFGHGHGHDGDHRKVPNSN